MFGMVPIVFRHLSPAAFCKRNVLTVNLGSGALASGP